MSFDGSKLPPRPTVFEGQKTLLKLAFESCASNL